MGAASGIGRILIAAAFGLGASGCLIVPTPGHGLWRGRGEITGEALGRIVPGESTREDVLLAIGEPSAVRLEDRFFAYGWTDTVGYVGGAGFVPGVAPIPRTQAVLLEFGPDGTLRRIERLAQLGEDMAPTRALDAWLVEQGYVPRPRAAERRAVVLVAPALPSHVPADAPLARLAPVRFLVAPVELPASRTRLLGRRTAFGVRTHDVLLENDTVNALLNRWCANALTCAGHSVVERDERIRAELLSYRLEVTTPHTLSGWHAECELSVELGFEDVDHPEGSPLHRTYSAAGVAETVLGPGRDDLEQALESCLEGLTLQLVGDRDLGHWLAGIDT